MFILIIFAILNTILAKPNIVFILADDWGFGDLSLHNHAWLKTPNIDKLASEGIDFINFNVMSPVCSPSRTSFLTGHFPFRHNINMAFRSHEFNIASKQPDWLDPSVFTFAKLLKQSGYTTGAFGKWHLTSRKIKSAPEPTEYGFDEYKTFTCSPDWSQGKELALDGTALATVDFIKRHANKPFYVQAWLHEAHVSHKPSIESLARWKHLPFNQRVFSAVITDGDNAVGLILETLKKYNLEDNTLVIFSTDNGPETRTKSKGTYRNWDRFYSIGTTGGFKGKKRSLYEGGIHVPFIMKWPKKIKQGLVSNLLISSVDLLPTLCSIVNCELPLNYKSDGINFLNVEHDDRILYWYWIGDNKGYNWPRYAIKKGNWKLLTNSLESNKKTELYYDDRYEQNNIASEHRNIVLYLKSLINQIL